MEIKGGGFAHKRMPDAHRLGQEEPVGADLPTEAYRNILDTTGAKALCSECQPALVNEDVVSIAAYHREKLKKGESVAPALVTLFNSGNETVNLEALRLLVQLGGDEALAAALGKLLTLPTTTSAYEQYLAAIADCRSPALAIWLSEFLGRAQNEDMRQRALAILMALRGPEVVESLANQLRTPCDDLHARDCAELLLQRNDPSEAQAFRKLLDDEKNEQLQNIAAYALANIGDAEACSLLIEKGSLSVERAEICRDALSSVSSAFAQEALLLAVINPALPGEVRGSAIRALSLHSGERVKTSLANLKTSTADPALQEAIAAAMRAMEERGVSPAPGNATQNGNKEGETWF